MMSLPLPEEAVRPLLTPGVDIAAVNGPESTVISGDEGEVLALAESCGRPGRRPRRLRVSHAFHSAHMEPMLDAFRAVAESLTYAPPAVPVVSNVTGALATGLDSADYWVRHVREPVRFHDGIRHLDGAGVTKYLEIGPDGQLTPLIQQAVPEAVCIAALHRRRPEVPSLARAIGEAHVHGVPVSFGAVGGPRAELPTYPFQRKRYWLDRTAVTGPAADEEDGRFWAAVDRQDGEQLARMLGGTGLPEDALAALAEWRRRKQCWYRLSWRRLPDTPQARLSGGWLVVSGPDDESGELVETLNRHGAGAVVVETTDDHEELIRRMKPTGQVAGVIALPGADMGEVADALGALDISPTLWRLTRSAVSATGSDPVTAHGQAALWADPDSRFVDLPTHLAGLGARLAGVLSGDERRVAVRASGAYAQRLVRATPAAPRRTWTPTGTVLVSGHAPALTEWLAGLGADVTGDTADPSATAVFHAGDARTAWQLHERTLDRNLTAFVLVAPLSEPDHVLANDALARHRRSLGLPATAIACNPSAGQPQWPGARSLSTGTAVAALRRTLENDEVSVVFADVDWDAAGAEHPVFSGLTGSRAANGTSVLLTRLAELPEAEREAALLDAIRTHVRCARPRLHACHRSGRQFPGGRCQLTGRAGAAEQTVRFDRSAPAARGDLRHAHSAGPGRLPPDRTGPYRVSHGALTTHEARDPWGSRASCVVGQATGSPNQVRSAPCRPGTSGSAASAHTT